MNTCPHCGTRIAPSMSPERRERLDKLLTIIRDTFGDKPFTARDTITALAEKLGWSRYEACGAWEDLRRSGLLEGLEGTMAYRKWRVKASLPPAN